MSSNKATRSRKAGSNRPTGIPIGPAGGTRSRAVSNVGPLPAVAAAATTPALGDNPSGDADQVVADTRCLMEALLEAECKKLRMEIEEQGAAFQEALTELHNRIKSVETSKGSDPEVIDLLKSDVQTARRDANHALEELKRSRDDADERFGRVATRLKALGTTAIVGPNDPGSPSSESADEETGRKSRRDKSRKHNNPSKLKWGSKDPKYADSDESEEHSRSSANESAEDKA